jgi:Phosphotransferase enzyme family
MDESRLDGGNTGGAIRRGDTVRRTAGPWTPAVHALLEHLARKGFTGAPSPLGLDDEGREVLTDFVPPPDATWRGDARWSPGMIIGHNDAAPYNAAWHEGKLTGFFDWDFAGPATREWDLAFCAFSWIPLHARHVAAAEGFTDFPARPRRLHRFLTTYGLRGDAGAFLHVVRTRVRAHAEGIRDLAATGDPRFERLLHQGVAADLDRAVTELADFTKGS